MLLPAEIAKLVQDKVASGVYGSESDVIAESLQAWFAQQMMLEAWLNQDVAAAYDEHQRNRTAAAPIEQFTTEMQQWMQEQARAKH